MLRIVDLTGTHARHKRVFGGLLTKNNILHYAVDLPGETLLDQQRHIKNAASFLGGFGTQQSAKGGIAVVVCHESGEGLAIHLLSNKEVPSGVKPISFEEFKARHEIA